MTAPKPYSPWAPVTYSEGPNPLPGTLNKADIVALQALSRGEADPDQQRRALAAIVVRIAKANDLSFLPDSHGGERDTAFAEGKRFVGLQVRKFVETPLHVLSGEAAGKKPRQRPNE